MLKFFADSFKEFKHISWPTKAETKKYLAVVVWVLTFFGLYLAIAGGVMSTALDAIRGVINPSQAQVQTAPDVNFNVSDVETDGGEVKVEVQGENAETEATPEAAAE